MTAPPLEAAAKAAIDRLVAAFFAAFSPDAEGKVELGVIRRLFLPQGLLIKTCGPVPEVYTVLEFIEPRQRLLNDGTLVDFREEELCERTDIFGNIACRFSLYRKQGIWSGQPFEAMGMKTIQFVLTPEGWRMSSLLWDDEREGLAIPAVFTNPATWCR
jgi:hypothetical protein